RAAARGDAAGEGGGAQGAEGRAVAGGGPRLARARLRQLRLGLDGGGARAAAGPPPRPPPRNRHPVVPRPPPRPARTPGVLPSPCRDGSPGGGARRGAARPAARPALAGLQRVRGSAPPLRATVRRSDRGMPQDDRPLPRVRRGTLVSRSRLPPEGTLPGSAGR